MPYETLPAAAAEVEAAVARGVEGTGGRGQRQQDCRRWESR